MPRVTVKVPVSFDLSDDELEAASAVNDVVGVVVKASRNPELRAAAEKLVTVVRKARARARIRR